MMMNLKVFGSICILSFVLLATVSAQNETTTGAPTTGAPTTGAPTTGTPTTGAPTTAPPSAPAPTTAPPSAPAPTTAPPNLICPCPYTGSLCAKTRVDVKAKLTSEVYDDDLEDLTKGKGKALADGFCKAVDEDLKSKNKNYRGCKVTGFSSGSVIVEYYLVLNTSSEAEAAKIAKAVTEAIKSGKIGNYTTDPTYTPEACITRTVKASDVSPAPDPTTTTVSTALLIILGVALFILLVIIIILFVLVVFLLKLKEKREKQ